MSCRSCDRDCTEGERMILREYAPSDCGALAELFYGTVHTVNAADYS